MSVRICHCSVCCPSVSTHVSSSPTLLHAQGRRYVNPDPRCFALTFPQRARTPAPTTALPVGADDHADLLAIDDAPTRASSVPRSYQRRLIPSATWSAKDACGGFCPARPRSRRSNHVCVPDATGVGHHEGNSHCPSSRSRRGFRWRALRDPGATTGS